MLRNNFVTAKEDTRNNNITVIRNNTNNVKAMIRRGEIYWVELPKTEGSVQCGLHPCVILQNNIGNKYSPTVQVCSLTSQLQKKDLPNHVKIKPDYINNLIKESTILLETITTISMNKIGDYIGKVDYETMKLVDEAMELQIGLKKINKKHVDVLVLNINNFESMYKKYRDPVMKSMADNNKKELEDYCNKFRKDYREFLYGTNQKVMYAM